MHKSVGKRKWGRRNENIMAIARTGEEELPKKKNKRLVKEKIGNDYILV